MAQNITEGKSNMASINGMVPSDNESLAEAVLIKVRMASPGHNELTPRDAYITALDHHWLWEWLVIRLAPSHCPKTMIVHHVYA